MTALHMTSAIKHMLLTYLLVSFVFTVYISLEAKYKTGSGAGKYELVWSDEFNYEGLPDSRYWGYEYGFVRNKEAQFYTIGNIENAHVSDGMLTISALKHNRIFKKYTSASLITKGKKVFTYGRFEIRAKIDIQEGSWPAFWTLGTNVDKVSWPKCGEVDIMEYYKGTTLSNVYYGEKWNSKKTKVSAEWASKFHIWRMDWDKKSIKLYLDNKLMTEENIENNLIFHKPVYLIVNQSIGGTCGGDVNKTEFPVSYVIDYIRVYQKIE